MEDVLLTRTGPHLMSPMNYLEAAVRLDKPTQKREMHVWISDDARRLPLVAVGTIDLGAVRATLTAYSRPGEKQKRAEGKEELKW